MNRQEFLDALRARLAGLPEEDIEKALEFYSEALDDRMEDGMSEEEAVASLGEMDDIVSQILQDISLPKIVKAKVKPKHPLRGWEIAALIVGFPLWFPLMLTAIILAFTFYIVFWAIIISLFATVLALALGGIAVIAAAFFRFGLSSLSALLIFIGGGLILIGLAILLGYVFYKLAVLLVRLAKLTVHKIKAGFMRKGDN